MSLPLYAINSPIGGFGNHLRWLLLLDPVFKLTLFVPDFTKGGAAQQLTPAQLRQSPSHAFVSLDEKIDFLQNFVYSKERTWHNWLSFEWRFRTQLQPSITLTHFASQILASSVKTIATTINPDIAYKHYLKINNTLNNTGVDLFKKVIDYDNHLLYNKSIDEHILVTDLSVFDNEVLDYDTYTRCVNFFELENLYSDAKKIHKLWYDLNKCAERQFVNDIRNVYGDI